MIIIGILTAICIIDTYIIAKQKKEIKDAEDAYRELAHKYRRMKNGVL